MLVVVARFLRQLRQDALPAVQAARTHMLNLLRSFLHEFGRAFVPDRDGVPAALQLPTQVDLTYGDALEESFLGPDDRADLKKVAQTQRPVLLEQGMGGAEFPSVTVHSNQFANTMAHTELAARFMKTDFRLMKTAYRAPACLQLEFTPEKLDVVQPERELSAEGLAEKVEESLTCLESLRILRSPPTPQQLGLKEKLTVWPSVYDKVLGKSKSADELPLFFKGDGAEIWTTPWTLLCALTPDTCSGTDLPEHFLGRGNAASDDGTGAESRYLARLQTEARGPYSIGQFVLRLQKEMVPNGRGTLATAVEALVHNEFLQKLPSSSDVVPEKSVSRAVGLALRTHAKFRFYFPPQGQSGPLPVVALIQDHEALYKGLIQALIKRYFGKRFDDSEPKLKQGEDQFIYPCGVVNLIAFRTDAIIDATAANEWAFIVETLQTRILDRVCEAFGGPDEGSPERRHCAAVEQRFFKLLWRKMGGRNAVEVGAGISQQLSERSLLELHYKTTLRFPYAKVQEFIRLVAGGSMESVYDFTRKWLTDQDLASANRRWSLATPAMKLHFLDDEDPAEGDVPKWRNMGDPEFTIEDFVEDGNISMEKAREMLRQDRLDRRFNAELGLVQATLLPDGPKAVLIGTGMGEGSRDATTVYLPIKEGATRAHVLGGSDHAEAWTTVDQLHHATMEEMLAPSRLLGEGKSQSDRSESLGQFRVGSNTDFDDFTPFAAFRTPAAVDN
ncbi:unnamed protein product [Amoebophrya sp. A120]|nr:unnamed protein product [Amoebophrya sp. A120]|eukprot:GSA120T00011724001.1